MKVGAYQAPLDACASLARAIGSIRELVRTCESGGVEILCCPEAILGGLADYASSVPNIAIDASDGQLERVLAPLASETVTTIVGFTEIDVRGRLFNAAAIHAAGTVAGIYRKRHPANNPAQKRSTYEPGDTAPVFAIGGLTFGVIICRDSTFVEPARAMAARGATALFVPTNNGLPPETCGPEIIDETRACDIARATENRLWVIRADVAGRYEGRVAYGASGIVDPNGVVVVAARRLEPDLIMADIGALVAPAGLDAPTGV